MKTTRRARRLGLDGNPLRRRIDKIAVGLAALLVAVFEASPDNPARDHRGAARAGGLMGHAGAGGRRGTR
jgi:hypothetical protein